ncbi:ABC transporter ATP-binding protein [Actinoplanes teichomyceticus]|uniref:ABC transporter n=1 Tax=Actinoplanes teichomyceticus TaxID=1867 RepID=Q6ZZI9_ACTTI|nr:ABC transporter ATP-binding protein [Actinoplanes teichomyceticus]TWG09475.1 ATP-binding cassette subfamily B protein [Actinoplanes teichomyceticus]GIF17052.1 ABC transporter ATP-binding protein [Actinoplanes teichomyceticus]CAE53357.1 ABC transporter [Actinoplanes teichomyceticus]CAG15016.1 ABC transporter [Actinoplanes teichomyceticus]
MDVVLRFGGVSKNDDDPDPWQTLIGPGTLRRVLAYFRPHIGKVALFVLVAALESLVVVVVPLLLMELVNGGILKDDAGVVASMAGLAAGLALVGALLQLVSAYISGQIGQGVSYDLRVQALRHVQQLPIAFFTRTQTGVLVGRLHTELIMAQQAFSQLLMAATSAVTVILVMAELFYLSWLVAVVTLVLIPLFLVPWIYVGRVIRRRTGRLMDANTGLGGLLQERFNVQGAMLSKLFGRPREEMAEYADRAERIRRIGVSLSVYGRLAFVMMALMASLATALVYGIGGGLVLAGAFQLGTLVALATLLGRLFGPITQLSGMQETAQTVVVSFSRIFEVLDLKGLIEERPGAVALAKDTAPEIEFDDVAFRYPTADEVSLRSLEYVRAERERGETTPEVLRGVSLHVPAGTLTALVGPSGAGKSTLTHLVSRLYDPTGGVIRVGGHDLRDLTFDSLREAVGVVSQDAYFFHDTIRQNLLYARPTATEDELIEACRGAQIWDLIASLPGGFDTVTGDRGYRLSGGEKQRLAIARLLLKAPTIVVLDEATAHLDSESEAAVQRALKTALHNRTSLVIAHRLSTIREADQILVIDDGRVRERGTHDELLAEGGLYAELYHTQFAKAGSDAAEPASDAAELHHREPEPVHGGG